MSQGLGLILIGLLAACSSPFSSTEFKNCGTYSPGARLSFETFDKGLKDIGNTWDSTFNVSAYSKLLEQTDQEMWAALFEVFSNANDPKTQIVYGSFSPDKGAKDGAVGFRVIWFRTVVKPNGDRHLITVITFWTFEKGKLRINGPQGALRIRSQLEAASTAYPYGRFAGLSYDLSLSDENKLCREPRRLRE